MSYPLDQILSSVTASVLQSHATESIRVKFDAVCDVLHDIKVKVALHLNREHPDALSRLPTEVHARCFQALGHRDCIVASQVCSRWRAVAIANRQLWTEVDIDELYLKNHRKYLKEFVDKIDLSRQLRALQTCFARAGTLPIRLIARFIPSELSDIIWSNIHRFSHVLGSLDSYKIDWSADYTAPQLIQFDCTHFLFPGGFDRHLFPRLRILSTQLLKIPETFSPMYTLESLSCKVVGPLDRIFVLFPNLSKLRLDFCPSSRADKVILPSQLSQSLRELRLDPNVDLSQYFGQWSGTHSLRQLRVSFHSKNVEAIVCFFLASVRDAETFDIEIVRSVTGRELNVVLTPHRDNLCKIFMEFFFYFDEATMRPLYSRTTFIRISCCARYYDIFRSLKTAVFPILTEMALQSTSEEETQLLFELLEFEGIIHAPVLRRVTFDCCGVPECVKLEAGRYPDRWDIRRFIKFASQRLDCFCIKVPDISVFKDCDMTAAFKFTKEVVCSGRTDGSTIIWRAPDTGV